MRKVKICRSREGAQVRRLLLKFIEQPSRGPYHNLANLQIAVKVKLSDRYHALCVAHTIQ